MELTIACKRRVLDSEEALHIGHVLRYLADLGLHTIPQHDYEIDWGRGKNSKDIIAIDLEVDDEYALLFERGEEDNTPPKRVKFDYVNYQIIGE